MRKSFENIALAQPTETKSAASLASNTWEALLNYNLGDMQRLMFTLTLLILGFSLNAQNPKVEEKVLHRNQSVECILGKVGENYVSINKNSTGLIKSAVYEVVIFNNDLEIVESFGLAGDIYRNKISALLINNQVHIFSYNYDNNSVELTRVSCTSGLKYMEKQEVFYRLPEGYLAKQSIGDKLLGNDQDFTISNNREYFQFSFCAWKLGKRTFLTVLFDEKFNVIHETYHQHVFMAFGDGFIYNIQVSDSGYISFVLNVSAPLGEAENFTTLPGVGILIIDKNGGKHKKQLFLYEKNDKRFYPRSVLSKIKGNRIYIAGYRYDGILFGDFRLDDIEKNWELSLFPYNSDIYARSKTFEKEDYDEHLEKVSERKLRFSVETFDLQILSDGSYVVSGQEKTEMSNMDESQRTTTILGNGFVTLIRGANVEFIKIIHSGSMKVNYNREVSHQVITHEDEIMVVVNLSKSKYIGGYGAQKADEMTEKGSIFKISKDGTLKQYPYLNEPKIWCLLNEAGFVDGNIILEPGHTYNFLKSGYIKITL